MSSYDVVVTYNNKSLGPHTRQIYTGLFELAHAEIIDLKLTEDNWNHSYQTHNLVKVSVNKEFDLLFDTNDGCYWIHDTLENNIAFFSSEILPRFKYVFKRSYNPDILSLFGDERHKFKPLGFNYELSSNANIADLIGYGWVAKLKKALKRSDLFCKITGKESNNLVNYQNFEFAPIPPRGAELPRILFFTRLWDPEAPEVHLAPGETRSSIADDRTSINEMRIRCLDSCRRHFKERFIGGLTKDVFSTKVAPHLVAPKTLTHKQNFLQLIKQSHICISTAGLHKSTGWKFGEYVAASHAIVSEKIYDQVPGAFGVPVNYLEFADDAELLDAIQRLTDDRSLLKQMMWNNYAYYQTYSRPQNLILNALLSIEV